MTPGDIGEAYRAAAVSVIPAVLGDQDREPQSSTYGCFDRVFWGWKFVDFAGARFQEAVYALASLYTEGWQRPFLRGDERLLEWAGAGLRFWTEVQYPDGSFDEAYPWERSLAATAFTGFYVGEAYLLLRSHLREADRRAIESALARAGDWLSRNDEGHGVLSNHLAAAAAALELIHRVTGLPRHAERSRHFLGRILSRQSAEGWYEEYGGADPGYQTHATFYLARLWQSTRDTRLLESLSRSLEFLQYCFHPDRTLGGQYGSRNTTFYFPAGFEILAPELDAAARIAAFMRPAIAAGRVVGPASVDSYNRLPLLNNYLFAARHATVAAVGEALPCEREGDRWFPDAGLLVHGEATYHAVVGVSKGGTVDAWRREDGVRFAADCGYWARLSGARTVSSQSLDRSRRRSIGNAVCTVHSRFTRINQRLQSPWTFVAFRIVSLTAGRLGPLAAALKQILVWVLVSRRRTVPLDLTREIHLRADGVEIRDLIALKGRARVEALKGGDRFSSIHMGSSRYFQHQDLEALPVGGADLACELMDRGEVSHVSLHRATPQPQRAR